jgi:O-methyltransferase involved in polyketide biosynthesis
MDVPAAPNTGRILDYWLGGSHHFPADIAAAQAFDALYPAFPQVFRTLRDFIGRAARMVADEGISQFLVLGSGIPTQGNVHEAVPGARVLYTDIDEVNVELGKEILADVPGVGYSYCDAADLTTLDEIAVAKLLDLASPLGVVFVGVSAFLDDATVQATLADIYHRVQPGSYLVADFDGEATESLPAVLDLLEKAGEPLHTRRPADIEPLLGRWELLAGGVQPVASWNKPDAATPDEVFMYGCVAAKRLA